MSDKEYEIPVKVIDRRWWANPEASGKPAEATSSSLKPTYVEELERRLAEKEREAQEYLAKYRGAADEFEKARLRLRREISKDIERVRRDVISELLDVADNLDRAIESARQSQSSGSESSDALLRGVELVRRQFISKLEGLGVTLIDAQRQPFDPTLHEAITSVPASAEDDGRVVGIIRQGYRIGDDVLRPAAVAVGKASPVAQD
jgi:molecular chaperone GrpE